MNRPSFSSILWQSLSTKYDDRAAVEEARGEWKLSARQLIDAATILHRALGNYKNRPLVVYVHKSPLYYTFIACAFLYHLDFCPLDIDNPVQRVLDIASQLPSCLILCDSDHNLAELRKSTEHCIKIGFSLDSFDLPKDGPVVTRDISVCSYYVATSGSTGLPKLVQVLHDAIVPFTEWAIPFYGVGSTTRWAQFSSIGFDLSLVDFAISLCGGATLIALSAELDRMRPGQAVSLAKITHWHSVPTMIPYLLLEPNAVELLSNCRLFTFCGESLVRVDAQQLAGICPNARIINTYGPTEATLFCSFFEYSVDDCSLTEDSVPIGKPIPSWNFVLIPEDAADRLLILSDNISKGYVGIASPSFGAVTLFGRVMPAFDTGDYFTNAGQHLYFSHRKDTMVKLHGNRIDLGEIESAAKRIGLVNPVAAISRRGLSLALEGHSRPTLEVQKELSTILPKASVPRRIYFEPSHPRTIHGKLDRRAITSALEDVDDDL